MSSEFRIYIRAFATGGLSESQLFTAFDRLLDEGNLARDLIASQSKLPKEEQLPRHIVDRLLQHAAARIAENSQAPPAPHTSGPSAIEESSEGPVHPAGGPPSTHLRQISNHQARLETDGGLAGDHARGNRDTRLRPKPNGGDTQLRGNVTGSERNDVAPPATAPDTVGGTHQDDDASHENAHHSNTKHRGWIRNAWHTVVRRPAQPVSEALAHATPQPAASVIEMSEGDLVGGRFRLMRELGRGGMGVVWQARDETLRREVALKLLSQDIELDNESAVELLQEETKRVQELTNAHIVRVFDFDIDRDSQAEPVGYMHMELLRGEPLDRFIRASGRRNVAEIGFIVEQLAQGLEHAHDHNVIHSDLKPGNVFLAEEIGRDTGTQNAASKNPLRRLWDFLIGRRRTRPDPQRRTVKVLDFGIARVAGRELDDGRIAVTEPYATEEMMDGVSADRRDDVYGFACIVYELLSGGDHPYRGLSAKDARVQGLSPKPIPGLSRGERRALERALAVLKEQRTRSADQFRADLLERTSIVPWAVAAIVLVAVLAAPTYQAYQGYRIDSAAASLDGLTIERKLRRMNDLQPTWLRDGVVEQAKETSVPEVLSRLDALVDTDQGQDRYADAITLVNGAAALFDSSVLGERRATLRKRQDDRSSELSAALGRALSAGHLRADDHELSVPVVLDKLLDVDPTHPMLSDVRVSTEYERAINRRVDEEAFDDAASLLAQARPYLTEAQLTKLDERLRGGQALASRRQEIRALENRIAPSRVFADFGQSLRADMVRLRAIAPRSPALSAALERLASALDLRVEQMLAQGQADLVTSLLESFREVLGQDRYTAQVAAFKGQVASIEATAVRERQNAREFRARGQYAEARSAVERGLASAITSQTKETLGRELVEIDTAQRAEEEGKRRRLREEERKAEELERERSLAKATQEFERAVAGLSSGGVGLDAALARARDLAVSNPLGASEASLRTRVRARLSGIVRDEITARRFDSARLSLSRGLTEFPGDEAIASLRGELVDALGKALLGLTERPFDDSTWQREFASWLAMLEGFSGQSSAAAEHMTQAKSKLALRASGEAKLQGDVGNYDIALGVLESARRLIGDEAMILDTQAALAERQRLARQQAADRVQIASLKTEFRAHVEANALDRARSAVDQIRSLAPDDAFLESEAPAGLRDVYRNLASTAAARKNFKRARDLIHASMGLYGSTAEDQRLVASYDRAADFLPAESVLAAPSERSLGEHRKLFADLRQKYPEEYQVRLSRWDQQGRLAVSELATNDAQAAKKLKASLVSTLGLSRESLTAKVDVSIPSPAARRARELISSGRLSAAEIELAKASEPNHEEVQAVRRSLGAAKNRVEKRLQAAERAIEGKRLNSATSALEEVSKGWSDHPDLGALLERLNRDKQSARGHFKQYRQVHARTEGEPDRTKKIAALDKAESHLATAISQWKDNATYQRAERKLRDELDQARTEPERVVAAAPTRRPDPAPTPAVQSNDLAERGLREVRSGQLYRAEKTMNDAQAQFPTHPKTRELVALFSERSALVQTLFQQGEQQRASGRIGEAIGTFERAAQSWTDNNQLGALIRSLKAQLAAAGTGDPCKARLAGKGRGGATCRDKLPGGGSGPRLVVVPPGGGTPAAYAISRTEISVGEFNRYCQATGACSAKPGSRGLPVTEVSLASARGYAAWLTKVTGFKYRLPTHREWRHAAEGRGSNSGDYVCIVRDVMNPGTVVRGGRPERVIWGKPNGWGIFNAVGNVQEWALASGRGVALGGSFEDEHRKCSPSLQRSPDAGGDKLTGIRLVRDLKERS